MDQGGETHKEGLGTIQNILKVRQRGRGLTHSKDGGKNDRLSQLEHIPGPRTGTCTPHKRNGVKLCSTFREAGGQVQFLRNQRRDEDGQAGGQSVRK